jgi:beta-lactamase class A
MSAGVAMPRIQTSLVAALAVGTAFAAIAEASDVARAPVESIIERSGAEVSVAFRSLNGEHELLIGPDVVYHAASTMKIPVMIELFRQARDGKLGLDDPLPITNSFSSIIDGSPYTLSVGDDSDAEVYAHLDESMTLRELCEAMITVSSNLASNLLIEKLDVDAIRNGVTALGANGMNVLRGVEDTKAFEAGKSNTTTARALLILLESIARGEAISARASKEMVEVLARQQFNDAIPAGVPENVRVAHKTGTITRIHHDAAIVEAPSPYVLVILVRGVDERDASALLMADISRTLYDATQR